MTDLRFCDLLDEAAGRVGSAGIEGPRRDARRLLEAAAGMSSTELIAAETDPVGPEVAQTFQAMTERRQAGEPVSRIIGRREFYGRTFVIAPAVLDPRPETELLVSIALENVKPESARVLDLGLGSGCILATLLAERPEWMGTGLDISPDALAVAQSNMVALGVADRARLLQSDWFSALDSDTRFDLIVSNPPYIASEEITGLDLEVRGYDPHVSLDGGTDGLDPYRVLARNMADHLMPNGFFVLEIGASQARDVTKILVEMGVFSRIGICKDLSGKERCVYGHRA